MHEPLRLLDSFSGAVFNMKPIFLDFETQSAAELRDVGGRVYAAHPSTRILCLCASWDDASGNPITIAWVPDGVCGRLPSHLEDGTEIWRGESIPDRLYGAILLGTPIAAHNANSFDRHIWDRFIPLKAKWIDTIHMARAAGLPGKLEQLGQYFLGSGKDSGSKVLKKLMRLEWSDALNTWNNRFTLPGAVVSVLRYCVRDVDLLRTVWGKLEHHPYHDPGVIDADTAINDRGVGFDESLAAKIAEVSTQLVSISGAEIERITGGKLRATDLRSIPKMHQWLESCGVQLPNLRKETVEQFLANTEEYLASCTEAEAPAITKTITQVLRLRSAALRITGAKLERASASCMGGRLRGLFGYHGAGPGRWTSHIVQVHNLPRGVRGVDIDGLIADLTLDRVTAEAARLGCSPDDVLSSLIRPTLCAPPGKRLLIADYKSIENRVLGWLSGEEKILDVFRKGEDPYEAFARTMFNVTKVTAEQRQAGKVGVLGCGYQMGPKQLVNFAASLGVDFGFEVYSQQLGAAKDIVNTWRSTYTRIAGEYSGEYEGHTMRRGGLWQRLDTAFKAVADGTLDSCRVDKLRIYRLGRSVLMELPSGRAITYRKMRIEDRMTEFGMKPTLIYDSPRGETSTYGGKLTENAVQGIARDLLADAMVKCGRSLPIVLHVHDELVPEVDADVAEQKLARLRDIMKTPPHWAEGLPLDVSAHISQRYGK